MAETQTLNPMSDNTDSSGSDDDGTPSDLFFSDDESPADPPPASPPPVEPAFLHLLPKCGKCVKKLEKFLHNLEAALGMQFDEHGVAVLPEVAGCRRLARDRGTVSFKLKCTCPKVEVYNFSEAAYKSLFV